MLEYASVIWSPDTRAQIDKIEKVQRQFTKRIRTVRSLPYIDRLTKLNLESLEVRRNSIDIAVTRSMLSGTFSHLRSMFCLRRNDCLRPTRGHVLSMSHVRCNTAVRKRFLTNRVIKAWNRASGAGRGGEFARGLAKLSYGDRQSRRAGSGAVKDRGHDCGGGRAYR